MEIVEIVSHYIDKSQNLINVEFRLLEDGDDMIREDFVEYSYFEEFGFDNSKDFNIFIDLLEQEDEWQSDEYDYIEDEDSLITFLNEYYVVYPSKLPKPEYK